MASLSAATTHGADVILNEFNAVSGSNQLDDGDSFFGTIDGNGGNWFELLVVTDHVDMRGWQLQWTEDEEVTPGVNAAGSLLLAENDVWADMRSGTVLTFVETVNAGGAGAFNTDTDTSFDPAANDWWINVSTQGEAGRGDAALVTTTTNDGLPGDFSVGKDDWVLTILDRNSTSVFGPVGEADSAGWQGDGVGGSEAGSLEGPGVTELGAPSLATWQAITPQSDLYDDTSSSSFGQPNVNYDADTMTFSAIQDLSALRSQVIAPPTGTGDFDGDGTLTVADIDALTLAVRNGISDTQFDLNGDGQVDLSDREVWVADLRKTYFGDANLDGEFSSADLVSVLTAGEYEDTTPMNSTWATGDWNGDGEATTSDFVTALSGGGYEVGPRAATAAAVPEPTSLLSVIFAVLALGFGTRRRS